MSWSIPAGARPGAMVVLLALALVPARPGMAAPRDTLALATGLQAHASGVFLNAQGDVLTARHAVADCNALFAIKDGQVVRAQLVAASDAMDVAVVRTALKPYLSATFPAHAIMRGSQAVFAESYNVLQRMPDRASTVFNALIVPDKGELALLSPVQPGASGSPVLGAAGLLLGVVVERVAVDGRPSGRMALSRARAAGSTLATRVKAVPAEPIKAFLREHGIAFAQSDIAQLGPLQAQAPRAATLSVGIICG